MWNQKLQIGELDKVPLLLPHEVIAAMLSQCVSKESLLSTAGMDRVSRQHLLDTKARLGIHGDVVGIALWLDGVTCKWDTGQQKKPKITFIPF